MVKWKLNKFTMNEDVYIEERPERAAPPVGSRDFYEKPNPYWLDQGARLEAQATSRKHQASSAKRQATSNKQKKA